MAEGATDAFGEVKVRAGEAALGCVGPCRSLATLAFTLRWELLEAFGAGE